MPEKKRGNAVIFLAAEDADEGAFIRHDGRIEDAVDAFGGRTRGYRVPAKAPQRQIAWRFSFFKRDIGKAFGVDEYFFHDDELLI